MPSPIRVFVHWQYRVLGEALAQALAERHGIALVGASGDERLADRLTAAGPVDVALVDASVEPVRAVRVTDDVVSRLPEVRVVPFGVDSAAAAVPFLEAGASRCLERNASLDETVEAIFAATDDASPWPLALAAAMASRVAELATPRGKAGRTPLPSPLTARQMEVLDLVARGLANKEIAQALEIRTATVKNHVHSILAKLGAGRRRQAVRVAYEQGLIEGPFRWCPLDRQGRTAGRLK